MQLARQTTDGAPVLIYSGFELAPYLNLLIQAGVVGIINKTSSPQQLIRSIHNAMEGTASLPLTLFQQVVIPDHIVENQEVLHEIILLSEKEISILERVAEGKSNKELAELLYISQRTVEYHLTNIFNKLNVHSRAEAVVAAQRQGLLNDKRK